MATTTQNIDLTVEQTKFEVSVEPVEYSVSIARVGPQGARGPAGIDGADGIPGAPGGALLVVTSGEALGGHRAVTIHLDSLAYYASSDNLEDLNSVVGITTGAVISGDDASIQTTGIMDEPTWMWTPNHMVYLGLNGGLTQTLSVGALFTLPVGIAKSSTQILINVQPAILVA